MVEEGREEVGRIEVCSFVDSFVLICFIIEGFKFLFFRNVYIVVFFIEELGLCFDW